MLLYHGSNLQISKIDLSKSKHGKDFGSGFYLSDNFEQTMEMAKFKSEVFGGIPTVMEYEFDEAGAENSALKILKFSEYSKEWAEFVFKNRAEDSTEIKSECDIVIGPIANDKVGAQIRRLIEKDIDFDTFLHRIKYMKGLTLQYLFGTEKAVSFFKLKRSISQ